MEIDTLRAYALSLPNTEETMPFGPNALVFKVNNKMFLLLSLDTSPLQFNVKCNPDEAIELREQYPDSVLPGFHMNKKHWNTVVVNGAVSSSLLKKFIEDSYHLVAKTKK